MSNYIPNTDMQQLQMLQDIGVDNINESIFGHTRKCKVKKPLDIPEAMSEIELSTHMRQMANKNNNLEEYTVSWCWGV